MTISEAISLLIAGGSLLLAYKAWRGSQWTTKEQLDLQRTMARLAERQLEQLESSPRRSESPLPRVDSARLRISIRPHGRNSHKFVVSNVGEAPARNVSFTLHPHGKGKSPLVEGDYNDKFPAPVISPGSEIGALAAFSFGSARAFDVKLKWETEAGDVVEEETYVTL